MLDLPDDKTLPPLTDRGLQGRLMDAAWPLYGGDMQTAEFWQDFAEGVRFAVHFLASETPKANIEFDAALNDAGWEMIELLQAAGPVSGRQFNSMKTNLKEVIQTYLKARPDVASEVAGLRLALEAAWTGNHERDAALAKLRDAAREVLSHRVGDLSTRTGYLRDNDLSREALEALEFYIGDKG